jgi:hypothetical protein
MRVQPFETSTPTGHPLLLHRIAPSD